MIRNKNITVLGSLIALSLILTGCQKSGADVTANPPSSMTNMKIRSPNFENGGLIPPKYSCQGEDVSPELQISEVPGEAKSLALLMEDPDAPNGNWVHWVVWNIPVETETIPENVGLKFAAQGNNSGSETGYSGPCPPSGTHRYYFKLFALSRLLELPAGATRDDLMKAMQDRVIAQSQLMGIFRKN